MTRVSPETQKLLDLEVEGTTYFYGTPLLINELEPQRVPGAGRVRALRASVPVNADFVQNRFVPHSKEPVVCVSKVAKMAIFRTLCHQSHHTHIPKSERRHGWRFENDEPIYLATAALLNSIERLRRLEITWRSQVATVKRTAAPFEPFDSNNCEFRTTQPVAIRSIYTVTAEDMPSNIEECPPFPEGFNLDSLDPYEPELNDILDDLLATSYQ